ncbi:hypothetical protein Lal_00038606 [Lupinus albus]|nr:hypothetical protein Lal_00038606 [Lupinus albus]
MTINKSQGQSLESVGLYIPKPIFSHGQLYVSISRILIHDKDGNPLKSTTNVVYKEVFQNLYQLFIKLSLIMLFHLPSSYFTQ